MVCKDDSSKDRRSEKAMDAAGQFVNIVSGILCFSSRLKAQTGRCRTPFTLLELMVVITVITILAALLMPALQRARGRANRAVCMSRLKQSGMASLLYCDDFDDEMPIYVAVSRRDARSTYSDAGKTIIADYLSGDDRPLRCPSNRNAFVCHYTPNLALTTYYGAPLFGIKLGQAIHAEERYGSPYVFWSDRCNIDTNPANITSRPERSFLSTNHRGANGMPEGGNTVYADNHVEWRKWSTSTWRFAGEQVWLPNESIFIYESGAFVWLSLYYGDHQSAGGRSLANGSNDAADIQWFLSLF